MLIEVARFSPRWNAKEVRTTSLIFRLATKYTVNIFLLCLALMYGDKLFGNVIECYSPDRHSFLKAMEISCWIDGLFIDKQLLRSGEQTRLRYGVGNVNKNSEIIYIKFYQWLLPVMAFQTLMLYVPRALWHIRERGIMNKLLHNTFAPVFTDEWIKQKRTLVSYIKDIKKKYHRSYAINYLFCEILVVAVIVFNMFLMKWVIGDFWLKYQPAVTALLFEGNMSKFNQEAAILFPIQAKCNFNVYGPSGSIENYDSICLLPQNVINEKIFAFFYVWYIFILFCAILNLLYFIAMFLFRTFRIYGVGFMLERSATLRECREISRNGDFGIWFTLKIFHHNMVPVYFQDLCNELHAGLTGNQLDIYDAPLKKNEATEII